MVEHSIRVPLHDRVAGVAGIVFIVAAAISMVLVVVRLTTGAWPGGAFAPAPMIPIWAVLGWGALAKARSWLELDSRQWRRTGITGWVLPVADIATIDVVTSPRGETYLRIALTGPSAGGGAWGNRIWQSHVLTGIPRHGGDLLAPLADEAVTTAQAIVRDWPALPVRG